MIHPLPGLHEPVAALTHLVGALSFASLSLPLIRRASGDRGRAALLTVYAFSSVFLLAMSGVYHMLPQESSGRAVLARLDKAAIFVLIAGTHTPIQGIFFRGIARWGVIATMWLLVATGITLFTVFFDQIPESLSTGIYVLLGWIAGSAGLVVWRRRGTAEIRWLIGGGVVYSIGAVLLRCGWPTWVPGVIGPHEFWHFAVLSAMSMHWTFLFRVADREFAEESEVGERWNERRPPAEVASRLDQIGESSGSI